MKPKEFKELESKIKDAFKEILSNCYTDFNEVDISKSTGQIFVVNIFYGEQYITEDNKPIEDVNIVRPILYFQANGLWKNDSFNINTFFSINDNIFEEFYEMGERKELDLLIPILKSGQNYSGAKRIGQHSVDYYFFVSIECIVLGTTQFYKDLLEEGIATIELDTSSNSIVVGCSQSERKNIAAMIDGIPVNLKIPFDKIDNFQAFQKETKQLIIDESYVFVAMSFQADPVLEDTYKTIQRSVRNLKKGLKCERVDDIQEDFVINEKIVECIRKAKLLIVDLTGNRPNVYYELGYARALGKQIILLCKAGDKPHFDVSNQNTIFYTNSTTLEGGLKTRLRTIFR